jgi:cob(I)alamin adenosyltransferase
MPGLVHIYTGDGKGKTTAAVGLGLRAWGRGRRVLMIQFLKGRDSGEILAIERLTPGFEVYRNKTAVQFIRRMNPEELEACRAEVRAGLQYARTASQSDRWDVLILDEMMAAIAAGFVSAREVADLIQNKAEGLELILTGRNAPEELLRLADYVSRIAAEKHPFNRGVRARPGIEY